MKNMSTVILQVSLVFIWKLLHLSSGKGWAYTKDYKMQEPSTLSTQIP